jgi:hypothetical protein
MTFAAIAAMSLCASAASAQTVLDTDLPNVSGNFGGGVATTTTGPTGTVTTVVGPGGGANRASAAPTLGSWYQTNVGGGGSVGITTTYTNDGDGAAYFATTSGDSKSDLQLNFATPVALSSLRSVAFDLFVDPATTTTNGTFSPVLRFNVAKNGSFAGSLVFEYFYQGQTAAPEGQWLTQTATLGSGIWWATNAALGPTFADANGGQKTLADWLAANNNAITVTGVQLGVGSGWNGNFSGAVDNVRFNFADLSASYNFAVAAVPEPATWAMMIGGFGFIGGALRSRRRSTVAFG